MVGPWPSSVGEREPRRGRSGRCYSSRSARAGASASAEVTKLVAELCRISPEFEALWQDNDVVAHGEGVKRIHHPGAGLLAMEFSTFAIEGRPELAMIIYNPATPSDAEQPRILLQGS